MIELALIVATAALAAGLGATILLRLLPTVSLQLAGLALLSATVPLGAVLLSGWVMFHMGADVKILTVTTAAPSPRSARRCCWPDRSRVGSSACARPRSSLPPATWR
jgi:hypothetical protein